MYNTPCLGTCYKVNPQSSDGASKPWQLDLLVYPPFVGVLLSRLQWDLPWRCVKQNLKNRLKWWPHQQFQIDAFFYLRDCAICRSNECRANARGGVLVSPKGWKRLRHGFVLVRGHQEQLVLYVAHGVEEVPDGLVVHEARVAIAGLGRIQSSGDGGSSHLFERMLFSCAVFIRCFCRHIAVHSSGSPKIIWVIGV
jgi:hypothetical protein